MRHSGFVRNFESALEALAAHGHEVHLSFEVPRQQAEVAEALAARYPNVTWATVPPRRDGWTGTAYGLRRAIDGLRYRSPLYDAAPKLRRRGLRGLPRWLRRLTARSRLRSPA